MDSYLFVPLNDVYIGSCAQADNSSTVFLDLLKTVVSLLVSLHASLHCLPLLPDENLICCIIRITLKNNHLGELNKPPRIDLIDDMFS
jgi:hypothetical protein